MSFLCVPTIFTYLCAKNFLSSFPLFLPRSVVDFLLLFFLPASFCELSPLFLSFFTSFLSVLFLPSFFSFYTPFLFCPLPSVFSFFFFLACLLASCLSLFSSLLLPPSPLAPHLPFQPRSSLLVMVKRMTRIFLVLAHLLR